MDSAIDRRRVSLPSPTCPQHAGQPSVMTCGRCGRFMCRDCELSNGMCKECRDRLVSAIPSANGWARAAMYLLGLHGLFLVGTGLTVIAAVSDGGARPLAVAAGLIAMADLVVWIGAGVTFLRWFHLVVRTALAHGADLGTVTPGGAVASFFIPFVNVVRPYRVMLALADWLAPQGARASLVKRWWSLLLFNCILAASSALQMRMLDLNYLGKAVLVDLIGVAALGSCILMVRMVQRSLDARLRERVSPWGTDRRSSPGAGNLRAGRAATR